MAYSAPTFTGTSFGGVNIPTPPRTDQPSQTTQPAQQDGANEDDQKEQIYQMTREGMQEALEQQRYFQQQARLLPMGSPERLEANMQADYYRNQYSSLSSINTTKGVKDKDGKDKFGLQELSLMVLALGAGVSVAESVERMINGNDIDQIDVREELLKNTEAITDPVVRQKIIDASYGDQGALNDLENLSTYNNQFGSLSSDMFNGQYGPDLEKMYQEYVTKNPGIDRDQFLVEFARENPTNQVSQEINQKLSRMGQLTRGANEFGALERETVRQGMVDAGNFYKPVAEGGYGFQAQDFRSNEQNQMVDHAMGLINSPEASLLKRNAYERVQSGGELGQDALREITGNALTAVDPSLQAQPYLKSGGLANSVLNTELAQRKRLMEDENALLGIVQSERNYMPALSGVVNVNTVDPVTAMGLTGKNSSANAINTYNTAPATGLNYDPTSGYMGSVTAQNANINHANNLAPGTGSNIKDIGGNLSDLNRSLEGLAI